MLTGCWQLLRQNGRLRLRLEDPEKRLDELASALASVRYSGAFPIQLKQLKWLPNDKYPRVLCLGVHGGAPLSDLAR